MENSPIIFILNMASAAALLIWAVRLVRTGFERAFGGQLRLWLRRSTADRVRAAACGGLAAILMQSSTAVAVLMAGFVSTGSIGGIAGLAILLGADVGSAVVAQLLNSPLSAVSPVLLLLGVLIFLRSSRRQLRQFGRILIGLALVFLSLDLIREASLPLVESAGARAAVVYLASDRLAAFLVAALFAWLVHSSVAAVLLFVTLAAQGILPVEAAFAMVLGANLGGALIAFFLTLKADIAVRRIIWANLILRGGGAAIAVYLVSWWEAVPAWLGDDPGWQALNLHLGFNAVLLCLCLPLVATIYAAASRLVPEPNPDAAGTARQTALDPTAQGHPTRAISCAVRELVHMGGLVETMHRQVIKLFDRYDDTTAEAMRQEYKALADMSLGLRLYLAGIRTQDGEQDIGTRVFDLAGIAMNLEAAADMIARKMVVLGGAKSMDNLSFSDDGWRDLTDFHDVVLRNIQLGISVLMTEDPALARTLVEQKEKVRELAQSLEQAHLKRLKRGLAETIETSSIHLDLLRALKTVNTAFTTIAYPQLHESGELLQSRLATS